MQPVPLIPGTRTRYVGERIYPGIILAVRRIWTGHVVVTWRHTGGPCKGQIWETGTRQLAPALGFRRVRHGKRPRAIAAPWDTTTLSPKET
jgi:hypothetical protein